MSDTRERLKKDVETEREYLNKRVERIDNLPIEQFEIAFPEGSWTHYIGSEYEFRLPMRFELMGKVQEFIKRSDNLEMFTDIHQHVWNEKEAGAWINAKYKNADGTSGYFQISFNTAREGSSCVIQQIGFEQKPVFEVICGDGAQEPTFAQQPAKAV